MSSHRWLLTRGLGLALAAGLLAGPARAGEVDRYLPDDSEIVVQINFRQILDSPLAKKYFLDHAREAIAGLDQVNEVLKDLNFDPLKDLDRVLVAGPGGTEPDRGLIVAHGRFDLARFKARADDALKTNPDILKVHKVPDGSGGNWLVYEVAVPIQDQDTPLFVALASKDTLLASPGKDYVVDALKKSRGKGKPVLKSKDFQALLARMDDKQSVSVAALGSALTKAGGKEVPKQIREMLDKLDAIGGGVTIGDDIKAEVVIAAKNVDDARDLKKAISGGLNQGITILAALATAREELAPVLEIVKSVKVSLKGKVVTVRGEASAEVIESAAGKVEKKP